MGYQMKKALLAVLLLTIGANFSTANDEDKHDAKHPCHKIKVACEAAGFAKGGHKEHKGLWKDCIQPVMAGQAVAGVTVAPADIEACKEKKSHKAH